MADNETIDKVFELAGQLANELEEIAEIRHVDGSTELIFTKDGIAYSRRGGNVTCRLRLSVAGYMDLATEKSCGP